MIGRKKTHSNQRGQDNWYTVGILCFCLFIACFTSDHQTLNYIQFQIYAIGLINHDIVVRLSSEFPVR